MTLNKETCIPCQGGIPPLERGEAEHLLSEVPQWRLSADGRKIERTYKVKNFLAALALAQRIAEVAEQQNHHPDICLGWGYCTVIWWTHKIQGLHRNDFVMAAKVDALASG